MNAIMNIQTLQFFDINDNKRHKFPNWIAFNCLFSLINDQLQEIETAPLNYEIEKYFRVSKNESQALKNLILKSMWKGLKSRQEIQFNENDIKGNQLNFEDTKEIQ